MYRKTNFRKHLWENDREIVIHKNQSEGIKDLCNIAKTAKTSQWVFSHEEQNWYNYSSYGSSEKQDSILKSIKGRLTHHHIHSDKLLKQWVTNETDACYSRKTEINESIYASSQKKMASVAQLESFFPSDDDLIDYNNMLQIREHGLDFVVITSKTINYISFKPTKPIDETIGDYSQAFELISKKYGNSQMNYHQLGIEYCKNLNNRNIGLNMDLKPSYMPTGKRIIDQVRDFLF